LKFFRSSGPNNEEATKAIIEAEKHYADAGCKKPSADMIWDWIFEKYGEEKGAEIYTSYQMSNIFEIASNRIMKAGSLICPCFFYGLYTIFLEPF
jgi:hypothetical protein